MPPRDPLLELAPIAGKYRLEELIATGDRAKVYRAEQLPLGRTVALKIVRPPREDAPGAEDGAAFQKRFFLEASTLSKLAHPNVVAMFDFGAVDGASEETFFIAMEFIAGETLAALLAREKRLSPPRALAIARQIARGVRIAHGHKIIHRDLKPSNVMISPTDEGDPLVKVVDFGLAKVLGGENEHVTRTGMFLGSPSYMPPEQVEGKDVDVRADVYAFGTILFEMLAGRTPFVGSAAEVLAAQVDRPIPSLAEIAPDVLLPPELVSLIDHCLAKSAGQRAADMDVALEELARAEAAVEAMGATPARMRQRRSAPSMTPHVVRPVAPRPAIDSVTVASWVLFAVGVTVLGLGLVRYFG